MLLLHRIHNSHPGGVTKQSFNAMSTHVSCLSLVNSPAGSHTVRSRPPTDIHRGVETGKLEWFNNSVLFNFLPYPYLKPIFPFTFRTSTY